MKKEIELLFEKIYKNSEIVTEDHLNMTIDLNKEYTANGTLTDEQYKKLLGIWEYSNFVKTNKRNVPVIKWDIDRIRLKKAGKHYFTGYGSIVSQVSKDTYDMIGTYQARTLRDIKSSQFILSMIKQDRNKYGKYGKN